MGYLAVQELVTVSELVELVTVEEEEEECTELTSCLTRSA